MLAARFLAFLAVLRIVGCNCAPPERFFTRDSPEDALRYFQYAVETGQYRSAYELLTEETREEISYFKFWFILGRSHEIFGGQTVEEGIAAARWDWPIYSPSGRRALLVADCGNAIFELLLVRGPDNRWRFDLLETLGLNVQARSASPARSAALELERAPRAGITDPPGVLAHGARLPDRGD